MKQEELHRCMLTQLLCKRATCCWSLYVKYRLKVDPVEPVPPVPLPTPVRAGVTPPPPKAWTKVEPGDTLLVDSESDEDQEVSPTLHDNQEKPRMTAVKTPSPVHPKARASSPGEQADLRNQLVNMNAKYDDLLRKFEALTMNKAPATPHDRKETFTPEPAAPQTPQVPKAAPACPKQAPLRKTSDESVMMEKYDLEDKDGFWMAQVCSFLPGADPPRLVHEGEEDVWSNRRRQIERAGGHSPPVGGGRPRGTPLGACQGLESPRL